MAHGTDSPRDGRKKKKARRRMTKRRRRARRRRKKKKRKRTGKNRGPMSMTITGIFGN